MIQFKHVSKSYDNKSALKNVNFTIQSGELVFLRGHSGAGKSTLLKLIALIEKPSSGQIFIGSQQLTSLSKDAIPYYRRSLGLIFQTPMLLKDKTVYDNVAMPLTMAGFDDHDIEKRVQAALNRVGLLDQAFDTPNQLSGGEQQRVSIARAVVHKPKILLADEPTGNLDPKLSIEIMRLFERFQSVGVTVLIASHDTHLLEQFDYRKIDLRQGSVEGAHKEEVA